MSPLISIVLPTYNGKRYLHAALESCLRQTYPNIEVIVVNDCSTDGTGEVIDEFARRDNRVRVITNEQNQKLPRSLNIGFSAASGDYFTWISDDNYFAPEAIAQMLEAFRTNPDAGIVYSSYYFIDDRNNRLDSFGYEPEMLLFKCSPGACFLYRKEVHEKLGGYDATKFRMEDMDFWLRAARYFRYVYIDQKELYYYRKHSETLTTAIMSTPDIYMEYRKNHMLSFGTFFREGLGYDIDEEELKLHIELYFEDIVKNKNWGFDVADRVNAYLAHLDNLEKLDWTKVNFRSEFVIGAIAERKRRIVGLVINDLVFENHALQKKNPRLARQLNKPISWYYKEYEVLPAWYKKLGHIIKVIQGNRTWSSLTNKDPL